MQSRFAWLWLVVIVVIPAVVACSTGDSGDDPSTSSGLADDDTVGDDDTDTDDDNDDDFDDDTDYDTDDDIDDDADDDTADPFGRLVPDPCVGDPPDWGGFDPDYDWLASGRPLQDRDFYLLTVLQQDGPVAQALADDSVLAALSQARDTALRNAAQSCGADTDCFAAALKWSEPDLAAAATEIVRVLVTEAGDHNVVTDHLRPSGEYRMSADETDAQMLTGAWAETMTALNDVFDRYARSLDPLDLEELVVDLDDGHPATFAFFEPLLFVGYESMISLGRDEAVRYEPLDEGENQAALQRIPTIDWESYRFPAMLVPGQGPEIDGLPLSGLGRWRCELAAHRYQAGVVPLIIFSGGHVHPDQTPFSEAVQMKRYVMDHYGVPEDAILIDPYARHTTTNIRNTVRMLARYGIPADRPSLITTDLGQAFYITFMINGRCDDELGYRPYRVVKRLTSTDSCFLPNPLSLDVAPSDPLDP